MQEKSKRVAYSCKEGILSQGSLDVPRRLRQSADSGNTCTLSIGEKEPTNDVI